MDDRTVNGRIFCYILTLKENKHIQSASLDIFINMKSFLLEKPLTPAVEM